MDKEDRMSSHKESVISGWSERILFIGSHNTSMVWKVSFSSLKQKENRNLRPEEMPHSGKWFPTDPLRGIISRGRFL